MEGKILEWYVRNAFEPLIEGVKAAETIEYNDTVTVNRKEFKQSCMREKKEQKNIWTVCKRNSRNNR